MKHPLNALSDTSLYAVGVGSVDMPVPVFQRKADGVSHYAVTGDIERAYSKPGHCEPVVQNDIRLVVYGCVLQLGMLLCKCANCDKACTER